MHQASFNSLLSLHSCFVLLLASAVLVFGDSHSCIWFLNLSASLVSGRSWTLSPHTDHAAEMWTEPLRIRPDAQYNPTPAQRARDLLVFAAGDAC